MEEGQAKEDTRQTTTTQAGVWRDDDLTARRHGRKPQRPFGNGKLMVLIETMMKVERALQESSGTASSRASQGAVP